MFSMAERWMAWDGLADGPTEAGKAGGEGEKRQGDSDDDEVVHDGSWLCCYRSPDLPFRLIKRRYESVKKTLRPAFELRRFLKELASE